MTNLGLYDSFRTGGSMRIEVYSRLLECQPRAIKAKKKLPLPPERIKLVIADVFFISGWDETRWDIIQSVFQDPILQDVLSEPSCHRFLPKWNFAFEVSYKNGVTDPLAQTAERALNLKLNVNDSPRVQSAVLYVFEVDSESVTTNFEELSKEFYNPLIQDLKILTPEHGSWKILPEPLKKFQTPSVEIINILSLTDEELVQLSEKRLFALSLDEMKVIQAYYQLPSTQEKRKTMGLSLEPTDVELEMLAQSWSEHCKHKIFQANIDYEEFPDKTVKIQSLFKTYIKSVTDELLESKPFLRSVFHDNSGVIALDKDNLVCFKVETHNSPSALDPYGGAITGIVGVNRDILGTGLGAKPIWNTDVLCFAPPDTSLHSVPKNFLHPKRVLEGVHSGIVDGGNHSGIPTVAGSFLFDESYIGKPLVFCGTGGLMKAVVNGQPSYQKQVRPGSYAVMCGGRIGKDGIHGATFSSLALDETSPTSAVQIGDPFIQKVMTDFLLEARDLGLYESITDNGAGGLSSSLGEMAQDCGGLRVDLDRCPLKYPGLAAWEIWVSESQERMSLSVPPSKWEEFEQLAKKRGVEVTKIGEFTDSGWIELYHQQQLVGLLSLDFVHNGLPKMNLQAVWKAPALERHSLGKVDNKTLFLSILAEPNVSSKEFLIRQYDHEVQGRSVVKPFSGPQQDAPSDGAVLRLFPGSPFGLTVTHGICPRIGDQDTKAMAACAVDEAFRAHIALGGDPDYAAILDNFSWPDPIDSPKNPDGKYKLAQLVRACQGLKEAALAYRLPIISGKDSMKNDAWSEGKKYSVRPTLLISLVGRVCFEQSIPDTDVLESGDVLVLLGMTKADFVGSMAERVLKRPLSGLPYPDYSRANQLYRLVSQGISQGLFHSVHDLSDGGLAIALAESCLGGRLGAQIDVSAICEEGGLTPSEVLFSETPSRFLVSLSSSKLGAFQALFEKADAFVLGSVHSSPIISVSAHNQEVLRVSLDDTLEAYKAWDGRWS